MKRLIAGFISLGLFYYIYTLIDFSSVIHILQSLDKTFFFFGSILYIPIVLLASIRFNALIPKKWQLSFKLSLEMILLGGFLNIILPAKLGDMSKAYFLAKEKPIKTSLALSILIIEKVGDMISLLSLCIIGLILTSPPFPKIWLIFLFSSISILGTALLFLKKMTHLGNLLPKLFLPKSLYRKIKPVILSWLYMQRYAKKSSHYILNFWFFSFIHSTLHIISIWLFFKSIYPLSFLTHLGITPLGLLAGLIPLSISGIGPRDITIISLFKTITGKEIAASFGILLTLRMIIFGLPGMFYLRRYLLNSKSIKRFTS